MEIYVSYCTSEYGSQTLYVGFDKEIAISKIQEYREQYRFGKTGVLQTWQNESLIKEEYYYG